MKKIYNLIMIVSVCLFAKAQYTQSFDSTTMPADWTVINGGDPQGWQTWATYTTVYNINPRSGSRFLGLRYGSVAHDDYAISPAFIPSSGSMVSFYAINGGSSLAEKFDVRISTTTPTAGAFTTVLAPNVTPPIQTWTQYSYDLSAYAGQTIYIAFYSSTTDIWFVGIDDFSITNAQVLGISESSKKSAMLYPNPVKDVLTIESASQISNATVYDFTGRQLLQVNGSSKKETINVQSLPAGNYVLRVQEGATQKSYTFIKK